MIRSTLAIALLFGSGLATKAQTVSPVEPARGALSTGKSVFAQKRLDGRTCAPGRVWQITGGSHSRGVARSYRCVADPRLKKR